MNFLFRPREWPPYFPAHQDNCPVMPSVTPFTVSTVRIVTRPSRPPSTQPSASMSNGGGGATTPRATKPKVSKRL